MSDTRYRLRGRLETASPLHLGSGETTHRPGLVVEGTQEPVEVAAVATDHRGRPYLPGTAIKGVLRSWAVRQRLDDSVVKRVFGGEERAGGAIFLDAELAGGGPEVLPAHWSAERSTGVVSRVAIDRQRRTASHQRLFHQELVPPGVRFRVEVTTEGLREQEVAVLLAAFEGFGRDPETAVGAQTADGWGRMSWRLEEMERLGKKEVCAWLAAGAPGAAGGAYAAVTGDERQRLAARAEAVAAEIAAEGAAVEVGLELRFDGPFLVNDADPERTGVGLEKPSAAPRRDHWGRVLLPASSLRGALRSRGERILRTLGGWASACGPGAPREPCAAVEDLAEVAGLCPACRVFGAPGWRTPLRVDDFAAAQPTADEDLPRQHFVAIDRFTGGAAGERKFDLRAPQSPVLTGTLRLDLGALGRAGVGGWGIALLVLVLRDLAEGDVPLGAGAARGFGACTARVTSFEPPRGWAGVAEELRRALAPVTEHLNLPLAWPESAETPLGAALESWVEELAEVAGEAHRSREER